MSSSPFNLNEKSSNGEIRSSPVCNDNDTPKITSTLLRAGAGTGKTTQLTEQVFSIFKWHCREKKTTPSIVVSTFSRKATEEVKERLCQKALKSGDSELIEYILRGNRLLVSTIHGILGTFLRKNAHRVDLAPGFSIVGSKQSLIIARQCLRNILTDNPSELSSPELVGHFGFDALVEFGLSYYTAYMENNDLQPHSPETLALAAQRNILTVQQKISQIGDEIKNETTDLRWHAYADVLEDIKTQLFVSASHGLNKNWTVLLSKLRKPTQKSSSSPPLGLTVARVQDLRDEIKELAESEEYSVERWKQYSDWWSKLDCLGKKLAHSIGNYKRRSGLFDFEDLELMTHVCGRDYPEVLADFGKNWDYWLLDEFQDTSPRQIQVLELMTAGKPCFYVGDPQQSIYLFRGARSEVFMKKLAAISQGQGILKDLDTNYRSRPALLHFINDLFTQLNPTFSAMKSFESTPASSQIVATFLISKADESPTNRPEESTEFTNISGHLTHLLNAGALPDSICILARRNESLSRLGRFLARQGLPIQIHAARDYLRRFEIRDSTCLLRFIINPHDNNNLVQLFRSPWFRVNDDILARVFKKGAVSYWLDLSEALTNLFQNQRFLTQDERVSLTELIQSLSLLLEKRASIGITEVFCRALVDFGYFDCSFHYDPSGRYEANLWKFVHELRSAERKSNLDLIDFINEKYAQPDDEDDLGAADAVSAMEPQRIHLMTIHSAKGLQFDHIVLPFLDEGPMLSHAPRFSADDRYWSCQIPDAEGHYLKPLTVSEFEKTFKKSELEERDRLLYVAVTRAKLSVLFSWASQPAKHSWASQILSLEDGRQSWKFHAGVHQFKHYSYEVRDKSQNEILYTKEAENIASAIRLPFQSLVPPTEFSKFNELTPTPMMDRFKENRTAFSKLVDNMSAGVLMHRLFEALKNHPVERVKQMVRTMAIESGDILHADDVLKSIQYIQSLSYPPLYRLICEGYVEWGYHYQFNKEVISGKIDLWGTLDEITYIIDYKTGNKKFLPRAVTQLQAYAEALKIYRKLDGKIKLFVVYPLLGECHQVELSSSCRSAKSAFISELN